MSEPFIAEVRIVALNYAPRGWAFCDGQELPISQNTALFSLIGDIYGGDGRITMGLPNLRDRAPMHPGRGPGLTNRRLGDRVGVPTVTLSEDQIPSHDHGWSNALNPPTTDIPTGNIPARHVDDNRESVFRENPTLDATFDSTMLAASGGGQAHSNAQPLLTLNFIIALIGLYPSRN